MKTRTDYAMFDDVRRVAGFREQEQAKHTEPTDGFGGNVGAMAAAMLAAAGTMLCNFAGRVACETDYLAISGATFPADVTREEMEDFNHRTLKPDMDEADEQARYAAIAGFWRRNHA